MKMKCFVNKVLSAVVALIIMCISVLPAFAYGKEYEVASDEYVFEIDDEKIEIYTNYNEGMERVSKYPTVSVLRLANIEFSGDIPISNDNIYSVEFNECTFKNLDDLSKLSKNIEYVSFDNCAIDNYSFLSSLTKLSNLRIYNCNLRDLSSLPKFDSITTLDLRDMFLNNIDGVSEFKNLESLEIYNVGITELGDISSLKHLAQLILEQTCVSDLSPLQGMNLEGLFVDDSLKIKDYNVIKTLPELSVFYASSGDMIVTKDILDYLNSKKIETNLDNENLKNQEEIKKISSKLFDQSMSDITKVELAFKYVVEHIKYDERLLNNEDNSLLIEYNNYALKNALKGLGCCQNYAIMLADLLDEAGIENYTIIGDSTENVSHIWNVIRLNGKCYYLDSTFADSGKFTDYFLSNSFLSNFEEFLDYHTFVTFPANLDYDKESKIDKDVKLLRTEDNEVIADKSEEKVTNNDTVLLIAFCIVITLILAIGVVCIIIVQKKKHVKADLSVENNDEPLT